MKEPFWLLSIWIFGVERHRREVYEALTQHDEQRKTTLELGFDG